MDKCQRTDIPLTDAQIKEAKDRMVEISREGGFFDADGVWCEETNPGIVPGLIARVELEQQKVRDALSFIRDNSLRFDANSEQFLCVACGEIPETSHQPDCGLVELIKKLEK